VIVAISSVLWYTEDKHYNQWIWFAMVGFGALSVFGLLAHTMTMEKPRDFARVPVYEFFAMSILVVSLVLGVVYFPTDIFPPDLAIQKKNMTNEKTNFTGWVISIGGNVNVKGNSALQIPIFILVAGNVGAYIRYLYGWIREKKINPKEIEKLTELYLNHKKIVNSLCISSGLKYDDIREKENVDVVKLKHMHKRFDENRDLLYFLPPISTAKLAEYVSHKFNILYEVEGKYEIMKAHLRSNIYERTIDTISTFFLAPILAIVAWLLLDLGGTSGPNSWETFAVAAFAAGLASNAIIKRLWDFIGEKFDSQQDEKIKPKDGETKPKDEEGEKMGKSSK
jgi:hypothetical protein